MAALGFWFLGILPASADVITADQCHSHNTDSSISCSGSNKWCGNTCQLPPVPSASQDVNCTSCTTICAPTTPCGYPACTAPTSAPSGTVSCTGNASCPANGGVYTDQCSTTTGCPSGMTLCGSPRSCATTLSCPPGFTFNACANGGTGACESPYVVLDPQPSFRPQTGDIHVSGDFYLTSGKSLRVDNAAASSFSLRNAGAGGTLNLGIGQPAPISQLDVLESAAAGWLVMRLNQNNATRLYAGLRLDRSSVEKWFAGMDAADDKFRIRRNGAADAVVVEDATGNVGINTAAPATTLQVNGNAMVNQLWVASGAGDLRIDNAGTANTLAFVTSNIERMRIDNVGNVGMGVTPITTDANGLPLKLSVQGGISLKNNASIAFRNSGNNASYPVMRVSGTNVLDFGDINNIFNGITFYSGGSARAKLGTTGRVAIGGSLSPGYILDIADSSGAGGTAIISINQSNAAKLYTGTRLARLGTERWFIGMNDADEKLRLRRSGAADDVIIDTAGNVNVSGGGLSTFAGDTAQLTGTMETSKMCLGNAATGSELFCRTAWPAALGTFVGLSAPNNGNAGGYNGSNAICNTAQAGSHVCNVAEIMNTMNLGVAAYTALANGTDMWINAGPPGYTAPANDCVGWTDPANNKFGRKWRKEANGGNGTLTFCDQAIQYACCR